MADQEARIDLGISGLGPAEHIGRGGFADVYRAEQLSLRRTVAVKVLRAQASDTETEAKFERECHAIGAVSDHPHIVGVHEGGFTRNGRAYLVMEYLPGGSLLDRLVEHGPMEVSQIVDTITKIARALSVAHQAGVLHRDVKPANIMISAYGEPALGDFGIARIEGGHQTATGLVTASFAHAAPEVLEGMVPTAEADVYSLGSTMYELMTGHAPYFRPDDESIWPLMKRILSEPMPLPESIGMSPQLGQVFKRATARDPVGRYDDAEQLADDLSALASDPLALARYPSISSSGSMGFDGLSSISDPTRTIPGSGPNASPPSPSPAPPPSSRIGAGLPEGPPPATKPDLMSLRQADTNALPTVSDPGSGRFSDRYGAGSQPGPTSPTHRPTGNRGRLIAIVVAVAAVLGAAVGGLGLWLSGRDGTGATELSLATARLQEATSGPLQAGEPYGIVLDRAPAGVEVRLVVDGEPMGAPAVDLPQFIPSVGRHSVAVEITTAEGTELTEPLELYARGGPPTVGYIANLARVEVGVEGWATALDTFDRLSQAGHEILELVPTDEVENLTPGHWAIYVPGFDEDAEAAEAYCEQFELEIPSHCHASYFQPIG